ncbi:MAG: alpha/beta hydrolase [Dehalobacter sp.]|nr:alpha/beta hydrolase [Dehalobacter sp.]
MKRFRKRLLKALSYPDVNIKKTYKIYRKVQKVVHPYFKPLYNLLDHKIIVASRQIPVRIFRPENQEIPRVLIFFHGGGWVTGDIDSYTNVCAKMADQTHHTVISVDYLLAPENPFPAGIEECYHVARELSLRHDLLQCSPKDITLIGDSAGGNLAAAVSLMARDRGEFLPPRQILIYPATYIDHSPSSPFPSIRENGTDYILTAKRIQDYMDLYVQREEDRNNPYAAPLLAKDLSNQPQTLIITAEFDPLRDEGEAYGIRLRESGNDVRIYRMKDAVHGFFSLAWNTEHLITCYKVINSFLDDSTLST